MTTSYEVRAQLEERLERDLLGPWDGPHEELQAGTSPAERYLLGRLVPHRTAPPDPTEDPAVLDEDPETVDREVAATDDATDPDIEPEATVRSGSMAASSLGLSFSVPAEVDALVVETRWARYERGSSEHQLTEQGRPKIAAIG